MNKLCKLLLTYFFCVYNVAVASTNHPNFSFTNNSDRDAYFIVCGANDLLTIKNLEFISPTIRTLKSGETYTEEISLKGHLDDKSPLLYLYPEPQGKQKIYEIRLDIKRDNIHTTITSPYADERVYGFARGKNIYVELVAGNEVEKLGPGETDYYKGLALRPLANERGEVILRSGEVVSNVVSNSEVGRAWNYEKFGRWAQGHLDEFREFIEKVDSFLYRYLRAGGIIAYVWRYGIKGARDIARLRRLKSSIEKKADVIL